MKYKSYNFVASCKPYNQGEPEEVSGLMPLLLEPIAGTSPRGVNVISGSSAQMQGFEVGKCYACKATEREIFVKKNGDQVRSFDFSAIGNMTAMEAMLAGEQLPLKVMIATKVKDSSDDTKELSKAEKKANKASKADKKGKKAKKAKDIADVT
jgi:hypothetical protein